MQLTRDGDEDKEQTKPQQQSNKTGHLFIIHSLFSTPQAGPIYRRRNSCEVSDRDLHPCSPFASSPCRLTSRARFWKYGNVVWCCAKNLIGSSQAPNGSLPNSTPPTSPASRASKSAMKRRYMTIGVLSDRIPAVYPAVIIIIILPRASPTLIH